MEQPGIPSRISTTNTGSLANGIDQPTVISDLQILSQIGNAANIEYVIKDGALIPHQSLRELTDATPPLDPLASM